MKPLIALTPDEGDSSPALGRPSLRRYELKMAYVDAVIRAGGVPIVLPYAPDEVERYVALVDGVVVTGGAFDVSPDEYGAQASPALGPTKSDRTRFERRLIEQSLARAKPVLGVCGGMQLLNVVLGGTLIQHIPDEVPDALAHEQPADPKVPWHPVRVTDGSRLASFANAETIQVNSTHHQAVARLGRGLKATGHAPDGVIEAIENESGAFVIGVQWHPELLGDEVGERLYGAFVEAARR